MTDASVRTVVLPPFAADILRRRQTEAVANPLDAVLATRNGTWHQVVNIAAARGNPERDNGAH